MLAKWSIVFGIITLYLVVDYLARVIRNVKNNLKLRVGRRESRR